MSDRKQEVHALMVRNMESRILEWTTLALKAEVKFGFPVTKFFDIDKLPKNRYQEIKMNIRENSPSELFAAIETDNVALINYITKTFINNNEYLFTAVLCLAADAVTKTNINIFTKTWNLLKPNILYVDKIITNVIRYCHNYVHIDVLKYIHANICPLSLRTGIIAPKSKINNKETEEWCKSILIDKNNTEYFLIDKSKHIKLFVIGAHQSGKTTFLQWLAWKNFKENTADVSFQEILKEQKTADYQNRSKILHSKDWTLTNESEECFENNNNDFTFHVHEIDKSEIDTIKLYKYMTSLAIYAIVINAKNFYHNTLFEWVNIIKRVGKSKIFIIITNSDEVTQRQLDNVKIGIRYVCHNLDVIILPYLGTANFAVQRDLRNKLFESAQELSFEYPAYYKKIFHDIKLAAKNNPLGISTLSEESINHIIDKYSASIEDFHKTFIYHHISGQCIYSVRNPTVVYTRPDLIHNILDILRDTFEKINEARKNSIDTKYTGILLLEQIINKLKFSNITDQLIGTLLDFQIAFPRSEATFKPSSYIYIPSLNDGYIFSSSVRNIAKSRIGDNPKEIVYIIRIVAPLTYQNRLLWKCFELAGYAHNRFLDSKYEFVFMFKNVWFHINLYLMKINVSQENFEKNRNIIIELLKFFDHELSINSDGTFNQYVREIDYPCTKCYRTFQLSYELNRELCDDCSRNKTEK